MPKAASSRRHRTSDRRRRAATGAPSVLSSGYLERLERRLVRSIVNLLRETSRPRRPSRNILASLAAQQVIAAWLNVDEHARVYLCGRNQRHLSSIECRRLNESYLTFLVTCLSIDGSSVTTTETLTTIGTKKSEEQ